jgi:hypothetical protein
MWPREQGGDGWSANRDASRICRSDAAPPPCLPLSSDIAEPLLLLLL